VHLAGFAPAFTLSQCDSEYARKPQDAHSLGRQTAQKPPFPSFSEFQTSGIMHTKNKHKFFITPANFD